VSDAAGSTFSAYSAASPSSLLTVAELREHVQTALDDEAVWRLLDAAEEAIVEYAGSVETQTVVRPWRRGNHHHSPSDRHDHLDHRADGFLRSRDPRRG